MLSKLSPLGLRKRRAPLVQDPHHYPALVDLTVVGKILQSWVRLESLVSPPLAQ